MEPKRSAPKDAVGQSAREVGDLAAPQEGMDARGTLPILSSLQAAVPRRATADVDVVIVNWNSGGLLSDCIASLTGCAGTRTVRIFVIDNASTDGSADNLPTPALPLILARNAENVGFGYACNQGAALGRAPVILFLNPDTQVDPDSVTNAVLELSAELGTGIVGAQLSDEAGAVQRSCARRPSAFSLIAQDLQLDRLMPGLVPGHFMRDWDHADTRAVDQVMGAFLMTRRSLFERLGGFDERFFVYYEDVDLCARAIDAGFEVRHAAEAKVRHRGQGTTRQIKALRLFYLLRSRILYAAKHHGMAPAGALVMTTFAVQIPLRLALALSRRSAPEAGETLRSALLLARAIPDLLSQIRRCRSEPASAQR